MHPASAPLALQLCCKDTAVLKLHLPRAGFLQLQTRCGFRSIATMNKKAPLPDLRSRKPTWDKATALADEWELNQLAHRLEELGSRNSAAKPTR